MEEEDALVSWKGLRQLLANQAVCWGRTCINPAQCSVCCCSTALNATCASWGWPDKRKSLQCNQCGAGSVLSWVLLWKPGTDNLPVLQHTLTEGCSGVSALLPNTSIGRLPVRGFLMSATIFLSSLLRKVEENSLVFTVLGMYSYQQACKTLLHFSL